MENNKQIKNVLEMYKKKEVAENYLHKLEHNIIEERAMLDQGVYGSFFNKVNYSVIGNNENVSRELEEVLENATKRRSTFTTDTFYINMNDVMKFIKEFLLNSDNGDYLGVSIFVSEPEKYSFTLEISANESENMGSVIIINGIKLKENGKVSKLMQYTTSVTTYSENYGDETANIELNKNDVIIHVV